jgi:hypothetical protein
MDEKFFHFSVDDVFHSLIDTPIETDIFSNSMFGFLKKLNDKFDINVDLYCFYESLVGNYTKRLSDVSEKYKDTLKNNSWIRFGVHGLNTDTPPHSQNAEEQIETFEKIYSEFMRICGDNYSSWTRLHCFSESFELSDYFLSKGVDKLLTTDKKTLLWRLPENLKSTIGKFGRCEYNGIEFIRTDIRTENLVGYPEAEIIQLLDSLIENKKFITLMTHEYELVKNEVRDVTEFVIQYLVKNNINSK